MKQVFRFAAAAAVAAMTSSTAFAGNWVVPAPAGKALSSLTTKDTVYVWNVGQKAWINKGESWGTQAVVNANAGLKYVIKTSMEENSGAEALTNGRYYLWSDNGKSNHYLKRVSDGKTGTEHRTAFVDGEQGLGKVIQWTIADLGGNMYSIQLPAVFEDGSETDGVKDDWTYVADQYLGVNLTHDRLWDSKTWQEAGYTSQPETYALWFDVEMGDNAKWMFVSAADYHAYFKKFTLKTALELAESKGVTDYAAEEAVFNKADATDAEIDAAVKSLNDKVSLLVTPDEPVDMTSSISNPDIENGFDGWVTTNKAADDGQAIQNNATATNVASDPNQNPDGAFAGKFWENWDPSAYSGKMSQTVKNLPNGVYKCTLSAFANTLDPKNATNKKQYVFFNDTKLPLTTTNAKVYSAYIDVTGNQVEMGLAQDSAVANWSGLDNAKLEYYGSSLASYKFITTSLESVLSDLEAEGTKVSTVYTTKLRNCIAEANGATSKDAALAVYAKAQAAVAEIETNVQAYAALEEFAAKCDEWAYQNNVDAAYDAYDKATEMLDNLGLTTEEINSFIAESTAKIEAELKNQAQPGDDVTSFITNPAFTKASDPNADANAAQDFTGWTIEGKAPGAGGTVDKRLCEVYEGDFNLYQDLKGIQKGAYKLEMQAFMRSEGVSNAYNNYVAGTETIPAWIYAGDNKQAVNSIFAWHADDAAPSTSDSWSEVGTDPKWYVPNTMKTAYEAMEMSADNYNNVVTTLCIDGNMRIGIQANDPAAKGERWMLFHDFTLTYLGNDPAVVAPVLQELVDAATITAANQMEASAKTVIDDALAAANKAIADNDGDAMMSCYRTLSEANDKAKASVEAYNELSEALQKLTEEIDNCTETASAESLQAATQLRQQLLGDMENGAIKTEEVGAKITAINLAINAMKAVNGSDDQPADYSWAIKNADMADGDKNWTLVNGSAKPSAANQVMEGYNGTFNVYQDIENLPEGTYLVKCQGFYRYGWVDANGLQKAWEKDTLQYNGKLYANADTVDLKTIILLNELSLSATGDHWKEFTDSITDPSNHVTYYLPDQRDAANDRFMVEAYPNELYTYVNETGHLRIGFCNNSSVTGDWTTASYFQLFYLGTDSKHQDATGIEDINNAKVVGTQYFTVDGRRVNSLTRGLNIIKSTDANGKTTVRKVIVNK